jgi:hypothetical protein
MDIIMKKIRTETNCIFNKVAILLAGCVCLSGAAQAALHDRGGGLIYDDVLNITWLQDANYAKTRGYHATGRMSWQEADKWLSNLVYHDSVRNADLRGWRLPKVKPLGSEFSYLFRTDGTSDEGYNISGTNSEFGYMYYNNLRLTGWYLKDGKQHPAAFGVLGLRSAVWSGQADIGIVRNLQSYIYWTCSSNTPAPAGNAWIFVTAEGNQRDGMPHPNEGFVWAVRDGDVGDSPNIVKSKQVNLQAARDVVINTPGLISFWTFGEDNDERRKSIGTKDVFPLKNTGGEIPRVAGGPFSGYSAELDGKHYFLIPRAELSSLNICGPQAQVSMFATVRLSELKGGATIAGIWSEGNGANDDTGTRQYAMLLNMPTYGGTRQLTPHISSEGGVTRRADGSALPWCADYAASRSEVPVGKWVTLGFTYDGKYIRAYFNGVMEKREINPGVDKRDDRYFTSEGPDGGSRGVNPYYHGRGIFAYDKKLHARSKPAGPPDFTIGARYCGGMLNEALKGQIGGLAVFNRALTNEEMKRLHDAANIEALQ